MTLAVPVSLVLPAQMRGGRSYFLKYVLLNRSWLTWMAVPLFDEWASRAGISKTFNIRYLKGSTIGIDAVYFLETLRSQEPHLSAVGGSHALEHLIARQIHDLQGAGINIHFVFDGLDSGTTYDRFANAKRAATLNQQAFEFHTTEQERLAGDAFQSAGPRIRTQPEYLSLTYS